MGGAPPGTAGRASWHSGPLAGSRAQASLARGGRSGASVMNPTANEMATGSTPKNTGGEAITSGAGKSAAAVQQAAQTEHEPCAGVCDAWEWSVEASASPFGCP